MEQKYIQRNIYLDQIRPFIDKNIIKVMVGQRRVGKSYMLFQIMDLVRISNPNSNLIYINMELYEFSHIKNEHDLISFVKTKYQTAGKKYLFIDEIQEISNFEKALRSLNAEGGYDIYCTGSNANLLSGELSTYLAGRYIEINIYGLSYSEFLVFHGLIDNNSSLNHYIKYGGLPFLKNLELEDRIIFDYLTNIYNSILYKDIISRYGVRNVAFLEKLVEYLADNIGNILSAKKISDFLKSQKINISTNIVLNYISFLSSAFFISKVQRANIIGKKIFEIGEKYFFEDLGLRHSIIGFKQEDIGKILENLVFLHLKIAGYTIHIGKLGNQEIDFVCQKNGEKLYVQVAYMIIDESTRNREFGNLKKIKDNYPKMVISFDEITGGTTDGIRHMHIRDFLVNFV